MDKLLEYGHALGGVRVGDPDAQAWSVARSRREGVCEFLHCFAVSAHALERQHLAVLEREDRLDVQELAGPARGAPDPAAPREVLERVQREDQAGLALETRNELVDLLVGRPALEAPLDGEPEHRDRRR